MKYFKIKRSSDSKIIGQLFPQIRSLRKGYDFDSESSIYKLAFLNSEDKDKFKPDFDYFYLSKKSKQTDLLSCSMLSDFSMIVSPKLKEIISKTKLPTSKFYDLKIENGLGIFLNYYMFHFFEICLDKVIFNKSEFEIVELFSKKVVGNIINPSKEDYFKLKEELFKNYESGGNYKSIVPTRINLKEKPNYDIFRINSMIDSSIFISEELHNKLINNEITGMDFIVIDYLQFQ